MPRSIPELIEEYRRIAAAKKRKAEELARALASTISRVIRDLEYWWDEDGIIMKSRNHRNPCDGCIPLEHVLEVALPRLGGFAATEGIYLTPREAEALLKELLKAIQGTPRSQRRTYIGATTR